MIRQVFVALLMLSATWAQTQTRKEFEVASIRPSAPFTGRLNLHVQVDGSQVHCTYFSLKELVSMAYRMKDYQVIGPPWIASDRFDIAAKLPDGAPREQITDMMQSLLADRFQVKVHRESKDFPVYALTVAKGGIHMKESAPPDTDSPKKPFSVTASGGPQGTTVDLGRGSFFSVGNNRIEAHKLTMVGFADLLARFVDRPVVDMTDLKKYYDFTVEFTPEDFRAMMIRGAVTAGVNLPPEALKLLEAGPGDSLFAAVQSLGLKLDRRKAPIEVVVVDEASKTPTEN